MFNKDSSRTVFYIAGFMLSVGQSGFWRGGGAIRQTIDIKKNDSMSEAFQLNVLILYNSVTAVDSSMYTL